MIYFLLCITAAVLIAISIVFYYQRNRENKQRLIRDRPRIQPSKTTSTFVTKPIASNSNADAAGGADISGHWHMANQKSAILVVDDQPAIRMMLTELFTSHGIEVYEANNGTVALELFEKHKLHCVLLDLRMPDTDGIEVLREIRKLSAEVPVILITAYADPEKMEDAEKLGISKCITKPFDIMELKEEVLRLLKQYAKQSDGEAS
ncbi:response regulator [Paenibacillus sp. PL91]|uniref:response regulator n=1 Tax=Paenibacillus sp. PL91 TaxID=2729538 RepID=UPI00145CC642|nr:response regulator [Paenibacillus sp. PL91]MBC9199007.1 response regulator [Paenibacillus sp. PL91]